MRATVLKAVGSWWWWIPPLVYVFSALLLAYYGSSAPPGRGLGGTTQPGVPSAFGGLHPWLHSVAPLVRESLNSYIGIGFVVMVDSTAGTAVAHDLRSIIRTW